MYSVLLIQRLSLKNGGLSVVVELTLPMAYAVSMAGLFAWLGRRNGFRWVAVPLLLGTCTSLGLFFLWKENSAFLRAVALATVAVPVVVAYANRATGYRWWPSFSASRRTLLTWLALVAVLLICSVGLLVALAVFSR